MTAVELIRHLQLEADELRKQKKRQNVTGLHKSVLLPYNSSFIGFKYVLKHIYLLRGAVCGAWRVPQHNKYDRHRNNN